MTEQEVKERVAAMRVALVEWTNTAECISRGYELLTVLEKEMTTPRPDWVARGGKYETIARSFAAVPVTEERLCKSVRLNTTHPTVHDYLWKRAEEVLDIVRQTLAEVPYSLYAKAQARIAQDAFAGTFNPLDGIASTAWEIDGSDAENLAIIYPFREVYHHLEMEVAKLLGTWSVDGLTEVVLGDGSRSAADIPSTRLKWTASTAIYVHIVRELVAKGYVELPGKNGKEGDGNITELFRRLAQSFIVSGRKDELSPEELQRRFQGRPLASAKAARLDFPEAKEL